jgi:hypothetical protein
MSCWSGFLTECVQWVICVGEMGVAGIEGWLVGSCGP